MTYQPLVPLLDRQALTERLSRADGSVWRAFAVLAAELLVPYCE
jgi:hypothetical protein